MSSQSYRLWRAENCPNRQDPVARSLSPRLKLLQARIWTWTWLLIASVCISHSAQAQNLLGDGGFDPPTAPLETFGSTHLNRWDAEEAALIVGCSVPEPSICPLSPTGMLEIDHDGLTTSQVNQYVRVTPWQTDIDAGNVGFDLSGYLNGITTVGVTGALFVFAQTCPGYTCGPVLETFRVPFALDTDGSTWERVSMCEIPLPPGTQFVGLQIAITNPAGVMPGEPVAFADDFHLSLTEFKTSNLLSDSGFEPPSLPLIPFGSPFPNRWGGEAAALITGCSVPEPTICPFSSTGMLEISPTGLISSEVFQFVDVSSYQAGVDAGNVGFGFFGYLNGNTTVSVTGALVVFAQSCAGYNCGGLETFRVPFTLDTDGMTWERVSLCGISLPTGTRYVGVQIGINEAVGLPYGAPLGFADDFRLQLIEQKPTGMCQPVTNAVCVSEGSGVSLSWTNNDTYAAIAIFRDGELLDSLNGGATSFTDPIAPEGLHTYGVQGGCGGGDWSSQRVCEIDHGQSCGSFEGLTCSSVQDDVELNWTVTEVWDATRVIRNSAVIATLPGDQTQFVDLDPGPGEHRYRVEGECGEGPRSTSAICEIHHAGPAFIRSDADGDGALNGLLDGLYILAYQFQLGPLPLCLESADADNDGSFNGLADGLYVLARQFQLGPPPAAPYPNCGLDPDPGSSLTCGTQPGCP